MHLAKGLQYTEQVKNLCAASNNEYLKRLSAALNPCNYIGDKIFNEITEAPPVAVNKGGVIKKGVDSNLDELRMIASGGKQYLVNIQQREAEQTGITT